MIHGPCGKVNRDSPCMQDGKCSKFFPRKYVEKTTVDEQGYPVYRRRENGSSVEKKGIPCDNRFVVPYNKELLLAYNAHINVEWCNQSRSIKYLFKYINKGQDRVTGTVTQKCNVEATLAGTSTSTADVVGDTRATEADRTAVDGGEPTIDEIKNYFDARYIYFIFYVTSILFYIKFALRSVISICLFINRYLSACESTWRILAFPTQYQITYVEMPTRFVYDAKQKVWNPRKKGFAIGRLTPVSPGSGPRYFLRVLLNKVKGPRCYNDIKTVKGIILPSYEDACYELGLLDDDKEYIEGLKECSFWASSGYVRHLFAKMLLSGSLSMPKLVWESCTDILSEDVLYIERKKLLIEKILRSKNSSLAKWETMPKPVFIDHSVYDNNLLQEELNYAREELRGQHDEWITQLTHEQRSVYDAILGSVMSGKGGVFFVYGFGGTGKTFLWNILSAAIRSKGDVVLNVASSGIASLLLPGGRTAHSRFGIPINPDEFSTCNIEPGSNQAELVAKASMIIWDEAPMMSKHCFEALDRTLCDIMKTTDGRPFGGKVVVFGGDFRQILPVIPRGNRADIVMAALNSSYLWKHCKVLQLTKNMRLFSETDPREAEEIKKFSDWILDVGDGKINEPNSGETMIDIPKDLLVMKCTDPIEAIVSEVYGNTFKDSKDPLFFQERAILCPTNEDVDVINNYMLDRLAGNFLYVAVY
ncbi:unnamed protein product [Brassica rapa]|uniref:ATP-dependent DNA helicase n=1 Tax=Brassica campestris TaxID=3711 RepID=A0A8D9G1P1_BRACM|nr:unnamed protein product [Brassica rapa]